MTEAIAAVADLSPLAAIVIIAGIAATIITQGVKRTWWSRAQAQGAALVVSVIIGALAYIVSGVAGIFPGSVVEVVSTGVIVIAAVALTSRAAYAIIGSAVPDGRNHERPATTVVNVSRNAQKASNVEDARAIAENVQRSHGDA